MEWESDSSCCSLHILDRDIGLLEGAEAGCWSLGIVEQSQGEGCCWLQRDRLRGCERGDHGGKCQWRKARQPRKQGDTAESCVMGGAIAMASLSLHTSTSSWKIERLAHQTPNALNYRVGPQPGGLLYAPDAPNNREGLQTRETSKCLNGWRYGARLSKEAFWLPATRGSKKTDRALIPVVSLHNWCPSSSLQVKQLCHLHDQLSLGQSWNRKKDLVSMCTRSLRLCPTLCDPVDLACQASLSGTGVLQARILEHIVQYWLSYPSTALYFLLP